METTVNDGGSVTARKDNELIFVSSAELIKKTVNRLSGGRRLFFVTDENVARLYPELTTENDGYIIPAGEDGKTLLTVEKICRAMLDAGLTRSAITVAVGGGVVGDVAGFAASVYMRGIDLISVPTTLLSQVDSSIGGKTGVNLDGYKNMIGAFKMPLFIVICPELLKTLPLREWRCGMGELVKTAVLDEELYAYVSENIDALASRDPFVMEKAVAMAAKFKKRVTDRDPCEKGLRAVLNLGHTVGHALEKCDGHRLSHGEYVMLGMKIEFAMLSDHVPAKEFLREADALLRKVGLPKLPGVPPVAVTEAAKADKKNGDGKITLIGLIDAGKPYVSEITAARFCELYASATEQAIKKGELARE